MQNTERKSAFDLLMRNSKLKFEQKNAIQHQQQSNKNECATKKCETLVANTNQNNINNNNNNNSSDDVIIVEPGTPVSNNQNESVEFDQNKQTELLNALHVRQLDENCDSFIEKNCCLKLDKRLNLNRIDDDNREIYVNNLLKTLKFVNINGNNGDSCDKSSHIIDCEKVTSNIDVEYVSKYYENNDYWIELYNKISKRYANSEEANTNIKQELNSQQPQTLTTTTNTNSFDVKVRRSKRRKTENHTEQEQQVENINEEKPKEQEDNVKEKETSKVESILWTEKYQFKDEHDFICNKSQLERLKQWLEQWKNKLKNIKPASNGYDSCDSTNEDSDFSYDSDCSSASSCCDSKQLFRNNALLINGPYGCGKTTAVYCVAQQLGFKVFEVNTSNYRNKAQILQDLIGVLSSHHVVSNKKHDKMSSLFNRLEQNNNNISLSKKTLKKAIQTKNSANTLDSFFKKSNSNKTPINTSLTAVTLNASRKRRNIDKIDCLPLLNHDENANMPDELTRNKEETRGKIDILKESLILFDDIDIVLKDDQGFWSVINFFIKKSKKPIILTCNDNYILNKIDLHVEQIKLNKPDINYSSNYLKTIALCERIQIKNVKNLHDILNTNNCDLRNSLLQLQLSAALHKTDKKQQNNINRIKRENAANICEFDRLFQDLHYIYYLESTKNKLFNNNLTGKLVDNRVKRFDTCIFKPGLSDMLSHDKYVDSKKNMTEQIVEYMFSNNENSENLIEIYDTYNKFTCKEPITNQIMHKFAAAQHKFISNKSLYIDYAPYLRAICKYEQLKQESNLKRRFLHYLNTTSNIGLIKDDYAILARENVFSESTVKQQEYENKLNNETNMLNNNNLIVNSNINSIYDSQLYDNLYVS